MGCLCCGAALEVGQLCRPCGLRGVLAEAEAGATGVLAIAPGRGYYVACKVTSAGGASAGGADRR